MSAWFKNGAKKLQPDQDGLVYHLFNSAVIPNIANELSLNIQIYYSQVQKKQEGGDVFFLRDFWRPSPPQLILTPCLLIS